MLLHAGAAYSHPTLLSMVACEEQGFGYDRFYYNDRVNILARKKNEDNTIEVLTAEKHCWWWKKWEKIFTKFWRD